MIKTIEKMEGLRKHYISIFNINGAHGFLYRRVNLLGRRDRV